VRKSIRDRPTATQAGSYAPTIPHRGQGWVTRDALTTPKGQIEVLLQGTGDSALGTCANIHGGRASSPILQVTA